MYNFIERLKICWNVLTKRNYVYFGLENNPFMWDANGYYNGIKKGKLDNLQENWSDLRTGSIQVLTVK